jgi:hypothetical protein
MSWRNAGCLLRVTFLLQVAIIFHLLTTATRYNIVILDTGTHPHCCPIVAFDSLIMDRLPVELVAMVAEFVDQSDITGLRTLSRTIRSGLDKRFVKAFFETRYHIDTTWSLEVLVDISKHPLLRKGFRCLELRVVFAYDNPVIFRHRQAETAEIFAWPGPRCRNLAQEIDTMHTCLDLLTEAFRNLAAAQLFPKVSVQPYRGPRRAGSHESTNSGCPVICSGCACPSAVPDGQS